MARAGPRSRFAFDGENVSVRREKRCDPETGAEREFWYVDVDLEKPDGTRKRVRKVSPVQTRRGAEDYERKLREALVAGTYGKEVPTFDAWFNGRFWNDWVIAEENKPGEIENKKSVYRNHLKEAFGRRRLDEIDEGDIASFRVKLLAERKRKTVNNILAVLSKALKFAERKRLIQFAPDVGLLKIEPPEIVVWELDEYGHYLATSVLLGPMWRAAACLAGEAGLRVGEIKALTWERDVDMVAKTVTVNLQTRHGITGTPKGRTRRTIPMTETLYESLRGLNRLRRGFVVCDEDGTAKTDNQCTKANYRICRKAGLPERGWHVLRHSFATDAARFGVNPFSLMQWLGHKALTETLGYIDFAKNHARPLSAHVTKAGEGETDPDKKTIKMLGARANGNLTATAKETENAG